MEEEVKRLRTEIDAWKARAGQADERAAQDRALAEQERARAKEADERAAQDRARAKEADERAAQERALREAAERDAAKESVGNILSEHPPLLRELFQPTFNSYDKRESGMSASTTKTVPPQYIPGVTWENELGSDLSGHLAGLAISAKAGSDDQMTTSTFAAGKESARSEGVTASTEAVESQISTKGAASETPAKAAAGQKSRGRPGPRTILSSEKEETEKRKDELKDLEKGLPLGWGVIEDGKYDVLYKHLETGLLHYLRPTGPGIPLLKKWSDDSFRSHLMTADQASIGQYQIWPLISNLQLSREMASLAKGGHKLQSRVVTEANVDSFVSSTVFAICRTIIQGVFENRPVQGIEVRFDATHDFRNHTNLPVLRSTYKVDQVLDVYLTKDNKYQWSIASIICEVKVDPKFPCTRYQCSEEEGQCRNDLIKFYLETDAGRNKFADHNVLIQIRTYLGIYHRRFGIITTLNTWTFVELDEDGVLHVSPTFEADKQPNNMGMGLFEVLLRFIVASIGSYEFGKKPNDVLERRPNFVSRFFHQKRDGNDRKDPDPDANWSPTWQPNHSAGTGASSSSESSSSAGQKSGRKMTLKTSQMVVGPECWADMEDPRRSARDGNLTWEESLSHLGALKDDAQLIGYGRCGVVYRKQFGDWDLAIKTLQLYARRYKDEATVDELRAELDKEARVYRENIDLQGKVIPRFFGWRTLQIADCFITEYMGPSFESFEKLTKKQYESALKGLSTLHRRGILHGDANLRNIVWNEKTQQAFWIDFAFSFCSENLDSSRKRNEYNQVEATLSARVGISPKDPSKKRIGKQARVVS